MHLEQLKYYLFKNMSLLFIVIIYTLFTTNGQTTNSQTTIAKGEDIICDTSHNQCKIDCTDTNCNNIKIYSSSNNTRINCNSPLSCMDINLICIGNYHQCVLSCPFPNSCTNSTVACNENSNTNAICDCEGIGCPSTSITTNNLNANALETDDENDNNNYSVNESVLIMFFTGFFIVVLCCFCVVVVALSFIGLYFGERKKEINNNTHKLSFVSSDQNDKSDATLNTHRMSYLSRSTKNSSYNATSSVINNNDDEKNESTQQSLAIPQLQHINAQYTIDIHKIINHEVKNANIINNKQEDALDGQFETESKLLMQEESRTQTEIQHEGVLKNKQLSKSVSNPHHQKFDSEDLYISAGLSTLQHPLHNNENNEICIKINDEIMDEFQSDNKICDEDKKSMDDIGSDVECLPELDGNQFHTKPNNLNVNFHAKSNSDSDITLDGHNSNNNNNSTNGVDRLKLKPNSIVVENNNKNNCDEITTDISAKLPTSPGDPMLTKNKKTMKHPPKAILLHPPTVNGVGSSQKKNVNIEYREGNQIQSKPVPGTQIETENKDEIKREEEQKIDVEKKNENLCNALSKQISIIRTGDNLSMTTFATYLDDDYKNDYKKPVNSLDTHLSITDSLSTFTIKSNPPSLSRTTSLNSAAAVCVAFPSESNSIHSNHKSNRQYKIPINITNSHKHRNYYSQQFYNFKPNLIPFEPKGHNISNKSHHMKTPPNSNRTDISNITDISDTGTEKPMILNNISKVVSSSMIVPSLPNSPKNNNITDQSTHYYPQTHDDENIIPPPPPLIKPELTDESVIRTRSKHSKRKKRSPSSRSKSRSKSRSTSRHTSRRDSVGSCNTVITKSRHKSRSSHSNSTKSNDLTHGRHSRSSYDGKITKKHRKRSSPKSPANKSKSYRRHTNKNLKTIKSENNNTLVMKPKRKIRRNQHQSVPSYNNKDELFDHKRSSASVVRTVKIKRNLREAGNVYEIAVDDDRFPKSSKSVNVPKLDFNANGFNPKWNNKRIMMTPPVDVRKVGSDSKRRSNKYENGSFGSIVPSQSMFLRNIIK